MALVGGTSYLFQNASNLTNRFWSDRHTRGRHQLYIPKTLSMVMKTLSLAMFSNVCQIKKKCQNQWSSLVFCGELWYFSQAVAEVLTHKAPPIIWIRRQFQIHTIFLAGILKSIHTKNPVGNRTKGPFIPYFQREMALKDQSYHKSSRKWQQKPIHTIFPVGKWHLRTSHTINPAGNGNKGPFIPYFQWENGT